LGQQAAGGVGGVADGGDGLGDVAADDGDFAGGSGEHDVAVHRARGAGLGAALGEGAERGAAAVGADDVAGGGGVGGEFVGGCTDTLDAWRNGHMQAMLESTGTQFDHSAEVDPYAFLPRWLQPR
jgi:hypothetical protein